MAGKPLERLETLMFVAALVVVIQAVAAVAELVIAARTASAALRADGLHTAGDLLVLMAGWGGWLVSRRPPSRNHPWGFGRVEDLAQLLIGLMIAATGVMVLADAASRMFRPAQAPDDLLLVAATSIGVTVANYGAARLQHWAADRTGSSALRADGNHIWGDMLASVAAAVSAGLLWLGVPPAIDVLVAVAIAVVILRLAWQTIAPAAGRLLDRQDHELAAGVATFVAGRHGVESVDVVRARRLGSRGADVTVVASSAADATDAQTLAGSVEQMLRADGLVAFTNVVLSNSRS